jgi:hypothetical protein
MRRDLRGPLAPPVWPFGTNPDGFAPEHAQQVHDLLVGAYHDGGGSVDVFPTWWSSLTADTEFDAGLVFVVRDDAATPINGPFTYN